MLLLSSPDIRRQRQILIRMRNLRKAARRASVLGRTAAESLSAPDAASSSERGEHTNSRSPSTSYSSCIDDERKFSSPHRRSPSFKFNIEKEMEKWGEFSRIIGFEEPFLTFLPGNENEKRNE
ncbi:hypothetical protein CAEBREN_18358 [Caenorhabditis brenneri]|uniref:Uncharacterized protein n=1 Tax=Caenorhabditis brenneri TaxID=135651 RepID=G0M717_CAEBE|nr:hypothetical protein CAEBREN_18358 [Caenorhabditis brenneri]